VRAGFMGGCLKIRKKSQKTLTGKNAPGKQKKGLMTSFFRNLLRHTPNHAAGWGGEGEGIGIYEKKESGKTSPCQKLAPGKTKWISR